MIGSRLGHFRITAKIGAGGMGEVYRAEDGALGRDVAIKVLPPAFVADSERVARFEREARLLASLSHPNIASIFEVGRENGIHFLVMELAPGETLAERIARGPMPLAEALPIASQLAEALEAAHERGIVHRDLKPANIMLDPDGRVKVLDFGLAKALGTGGEATSAPDQSHSPTLAQHASLAGVLLGTAAYMSPEQATGRPADRRADLWAFGVVVWEMLTGESLFTGETVSDVLAAVLRAEIDASALPPSTPSAIRRMLRRCLVRDPRQRLRDAGDARLEIADVVAGRDEPLSPGRARFSRLAASLGLAAVAVLAVLAGWLALRPRGLPPEPVVRVPLMLPEGFRLARRIQTVLAISPDGRRVVLVAYGPDGTDALLARDLGQLEPRVLEGTAGAQSPFFSPDGDWVGFFSGGQLRRVPFAGGPVERLATASDQPRGADWSPDGTIFVAPHPEKGLFRLAAGGELVPVTQLDARRRERTHRWPRVLPGGRHVLFTCDTIDSPQDYDDARLEAVTVATGERKVVLEGTSRGLYVNSGHLVFARGGSLFAAPFDIDRLEVTGAARPVLHGVSTQVGTGAAQFTISSTGSLFYTPGTAEQVPRRLVWVIGKGTAEPAAAPPGLYVHLALAPGGQRVAMTRPGERRNDVWIADLARGTVNRLTFGGGTIPVWTPDGRRMAYSRSTNASFLPEESHEVLWKAADGSDQEQLLWRSDVPISPSTFSPDGKVLIVWRSEAAPATTGPQGARGLAEAPVSRDMVAGAADLWVVPLDGGEARPLFTAPGFQYAAEFSPDGRWLAYLSDESGRYEVYVRRFTGAGGQWQVSANGGFEPHWSSDGRYLFYRTRTDLVRLPVQLGGTTFAAGSAEVVATGLSDTSNPRSYGVAPDGRILSLQLLAKHEATQPVLVMGFFRELEGLRVPKQGE